MSAKGMQLNTPCAKIRIGRLNTLSGIRVELARVYRDCRRGQLNPSAGTRLAFVLQCLHKLIELESIEQRVQALEELQQHGK
jgi:hypothetical protein